LRNGHCFEGELKSSVVSGGISKQVNDIIHPTPPPARPLLGVSEGRREAQATPIQGF